MKNFKLLCVVGLISAFFAPATAGTRTMSQDDFIRLLTRGKGEYVSDAEAFLFKLPPSDRPTYCHALIENFSRVIDKNSPLAAAYIAGKVIAALGLCGEEKAYKAAIDLFIEVVRIEKKEQIMKGQDVTMSYKFTMRCETTLFGILDANKEPALAALRPILSRCVSFSNIIDREVCYKLATMGVELKDVQAIPYLLSFALNTDLQADAQNRQSRALSLLQLFKDDIRVKDATASLAKNAINPMVKSTAEFILKTQKERRDIGK